MQHVLRPTVVGHVHCEQSSFFSGQVGCDLNMGGLIRTVPTAADKEVRAEPTEVTTVGKSRSSQPGSDRHTVFGQLSR
jgi:hypothetical protein